MTLLFASPASQLLQSIVIMLLAVLLVGLFMKRLNQPYFVAYIIAGILLGPYRFKIFTEPATIAAIGELGLLMQMFFIGMKIEIQTLVQQIRKPLLGVVAQLLFSFVFILALGIFNAWSMKEILLFTFIISLSSSAIILDYLEKNKELNLPLGTLTSGILVMQDFLLVPMLLTINFLGKKEISIYQITPLIIAAILITILLREVVLKRRLKLPLLDKLNSDHELQVFAGLLLCFGFAWLTQLINLSAAIGALVGGVFISQTGAMHWLEAKLVPFRVFFLSLFFLSVGLQINARFLWQHAVVILLLVAIILLVNSAINALVFRLLKESWRNSIYAGALLSQIGEFSLVLVLVARNQQLANEFWYQLTLAVVSVTMLFTAIWINIIRAFIYKTAAVTITKTATIRQISH